MNVFDLAARLTLDKSDYEKGLTEAESEGKSFGSSLKDAGKKLATAGAAVAGVGGALFAFANKSAENADNIDKMSQKIGISAEAYQEWDYIMTRSGADVDGLKMGVKTMNTQLTKAKEVIEKTYKADDELTASLERGEISLEDYNKQYDELYDKAYEDVGALKQLGFSLEDIREFADDPEAALKNIITALQNMPEGTERATLATELLGRSGADMGALLNTSAEETERLRQEVHDLGGVLSDEAVKDGAAFKDSLTALKTAFSGAASELAKELMPYIKDFIERITKFIKEGGLKKIIDNFKKLIPLLKTGAAAFLAFKSITTLVGIFSSVSKAIQGVTAVQGVLNGVMAANPFGAVAVAIGVLVGALTYLWNTSDDFRGAMKLILEDIGGFFSDCFDGITAIFEDLPAFFSWVWEGIQNAFAAVGEWFSGVFSGAWEGIQTAWASVTGWFGDVWKGIKEVFSGAWGSVTSWFGGIFLDAAGAISKAWGDVVDFFGRIWEGIKKKFADVADWFGRTFKKAADKIAENFNPFAIVDVIKEGGEGFKDFTMGVLADITGSSEKTTTTQPAVVPAAGATIETTNNVYIGGEKIDEYITRSGQNQNYRSGGR